MPISPSAAWAIWRRARDVERARRKRAKAGVEPRVSKIPLLPPGARDAFLRLALMENRCAAPVGLFAVIPGSSPPLQL
jgi:hypothetical protein